MFVGILVFDCNLALAVFYMTFCTIIRLLHHYIFVFCTIICSILNFQFYNWNFSFFKLELSISHVGICTFKSECSIFQIGTLYFWNQNFLPFNKLVWNNPVISRQTCLQKSCQFLLSEQRLQFSVKYLLPLACLQNLLLIHEFNQDIILIMSENKLSIA